MPCVRACVVCARRQLRSREQQAVDAMLRERAAMKNKQVLRATIASAQHLQGSTNGGT